jgi:REP element-mobilizing transposase RayT
MARGNRRQPIFCDDDDRRFFLGTLSEACKRTGWQIHAWVLMGNHYHLLAETPEPNLVDGMKWFQNTYTRRFNTRHQLWGRIFGDRYKAVPIEEGSEFYYGSLVDYIHLNPVRAGLVKVTAGKGLLDYEWSSLASAYALPPGRRAPWVAAAQGLSSMNFPDTAAGRRRYVEHLETRVRTEPRRECGVAPPPREDARASHLRRGWYWGSQMFEEKLLAMLGSHPKAGANRNYRSAPAHKDHGQRRAQALLEAGLRRHGIENAALESLPGADPRKAEIAMEIWEATTVSQAWIAGRLKMKSAANVSQIIRRKKAPPRPLVNI